jgi:hypothetical protein
MTYAPEYFGGTTSTDTSGDLGRAYRSSSNTTPIEFTWPVPNATITGTKGDGTPLEGEVTYLQQEGSQYWYRLAHDADDRPSGAGTVGYVFSDGTYTRTMSLVVDDATGSSTVVIPSAQVVPERMSECPRSLLSFVGETSSQSITILDSDGETAVDLSGETLIVIFEEEDGSDLATVHDAAITIGGTDNNVISFSIPSAVTDRDRLANYAIRRVGGDKYVFDQGQVVVKYTPQAD